MAGSGSQGERASQASTTPLGTHVGSVDAPTEERASAVVRSDPIGRDPVDQRPMARMRGWLQRIGNPRAKPAADGSRQHVLDGVSWRLGLRGYEGC